MYDWANRAYSTYQITILMLYLTQVVLPGASGQIAYGYGIGISTLVAGIILPRSWRRGRCACEQALLVVHMYASRPCESVAMFSCPWKCRGRSSGCFSRPACHLSWRGAWYPAFLPEIADEKSMNRVSAYGFAMGYVGGGLALLVGVLVVQFGDRLGLPSNLEETASLGTKSILLSACRRVITT